MSSRQLRKLQQQRELGKVANSVAFESKDSEDVEVSVAAPKPRPNLFAALGAEDEDQGDGEDEDEGDTAMDQGDRDVSRVSHPANSRRTKKKKQQRKKKNAKAPAGDAAGEDEDEIDKAVKELKIDARSINDSPAHNARGGSRSRMGELLSINTLHLRAANEMRSLFGRDVMESANAEEQQESSRRRRAPVQRQVDLESFLREPPGAPKLPEVSLRRNVFVQGRDHWPRQSAGGLAMEEVEKAPDGSWTEYAYVHDKEYDSMQTVFFACVQIGDPMRMVHLLKRVREYSQAICSHIRVMQANVQKHTMSRRCSRSAAWPSRTRTWPCRQNCAKGRSSRSGE